MENRDASDDGQTDSQIDTATADLDVHSNQEIRVPLLFEYSRKTTSSSSRTSNEIRTEEDSQPQSRIVHATIAKSECTTFDSVCITQPILPQFTCPLAALTMNLSFAGCGFLGIYHLGAVTALVKHGPQFLFNVQKFTGASAGALVAAVLAIRGADLDALERCREFTIQLAADVHRKRFGPLTPGVSLLEPLESFIRDIIPDNAHELATERLFISVTRRQDRKNNLLSHFKSNEHLIQCLMASSYIPRITGSRTIYIDAERYIDGGMTDNLPILDGGRTIRVSPFCGKQEICPSDGTKRQWFTSINKQHYQLNQQNVVRGVHALFPPKPKRIEQYYNGGFQDAVRFLRNEGFHCSDINPNNNV